MSMFWTAVALLGVLAGLLVLLPLRRAAQPAEADGAADARRAQNLAAYRQQLAELEAARAGGALDETQFAAARLELDRRVLEDTAAAPAPAAGAGNGRLALLACALAVPVLALGLYRHLGATSEIELAGLIAQLEQEMTAEQRAELLARLQPRLEAQVSRGDPHGDYRFLLARLYTAGGALSAGGGALRGTGRSLSRGRGNDRAVGAGAVPRGRAHAHARGAGPDRSRLRHRPGAGHAAGAGRHGPLPGRRLPRCGRLLAEAARPPAPGRPRRGRHSRRHRDGALAPRRERRTGAARRGQRQPRHAGCGRRSAPAGRGQPRAGAASCAPGIPCSCSRALSAARRCPWPWRVFRPPNCRNRWS